MLDPKNIEFVDYNNINNIIIEQEYNKSLIILDKLIQIMEERFVLLRSTKLDNFKSVVLIVDEFADLILQDKDNSFYNKLCKLCQKCRAAKIHIILSTQRPSFDIISGAIKANFPARISCKVASHVDSKVVLDSSGAECLSGFGDALICDNFRHLERFQIAYTDAKEVCRYFGSI